MPRLLLLLALLSGCAHLSGPPPPPRDFALTLALTGGMTGEGERIEVVGSNAPMFSHRATVTPEALQRLWDDLRADFRAQDAPTGVALTRLIVVHAYGRTQTARWVPGTEPDLDRLYDRLWRTVRTGSAWPVLGAPTPAPPRR